MAEVDLWRYLATALTMPCLVPLVLILIPWWRYPLRKMCLLALALEAALAGGCLAIYGALGFSQAALWLAGCLLPALCVLVFSFCCELRDGRLFFLLTSLGLFVSLCDALASMFAARGQPGWTFIRLTLILLFTLLLWRFGRKPLLEMLELNQIRWAQVAVIPLALSASLMSFYLPRIAQGRRTSFPSTLIFCVTVVLVYLTLYRFQRATLEQTEIRQGAELLRSEVEFLHRQAALAEQASESMRVFRHDIRHYVSVLQGCLDAGETGAARKVLEQMRQNAETDGDWAALHHYTGLPALDTVLTQAAARAAACGVDFQAALTLPSALRVDGTELAVAVSNALENALDAAAQEPESPPRSVRVCSQPSGRQWFLVVSNTFSGVLEKDEKTGLPRAARPGHGYGTRSIANFAHKYGCLADCSVQDGMFHLRLLI